MRKFQHKITKHPAQSFRELVYFCSPEGRCSYQDVPADHLEQLTRMLDREGSEGWELVQLAFGRDGVAAFWKRELQK